MIEIRTTCTAGEAVGHCKLTVSGHAGAGPKGRDLVCAAVSTLVETLAGWIIEDPDGRFRVERTAVLLDEGYALVEATAWGEHVPALMERFGLVEYGLKNLAEQYPEFVTFGDGQGERKDHEG